VSYQPLNNATEIPPIDPNLIGKEGEDMNDEDVASPEPIYVPRKVIPLSPILVRIVWEHRGQNFSGIINSIREHAWFKMKAFKSIESRKNYLHLIYRTIQAFWSHGQQETNGNPALAKFIRCSPGKVAKITTFKWAVDKANSTTEALALHLEGYPLRDSEGHTHQDNEELESLDEAEDQQLTQDRKTRGCRVRFTEDTRNQDVQDTKEILSAVKDMAALLINKNANKDSEEVIQENSWSYKAVKLASSTSKTTAAQTISADYQEITKLSDKHARDTIARNLNQLRKANFRVDKVMASYIRSGNIFRPSPELTGNISLFHCYPRKPIELQDIMTGEEFELKMKAKIITAKTVNGQLEQKLGMAQSAHTFTRQLYNFWQFTAFMFGDDAWISKKLQDLHELFKELEEDLDSIAERDDEYILQLAAIINNRYHMFLSSCVEADGDITKVEWSHVERLQGSMGDFIRTREKPAIVMTKVLHGISDQTKRELQAKRKRDYTNPEDPGAGDPNARRQRLAKQRNNGDNDEGAEREVDPAKTNDKVRKEWKMSMNEFRRVMGPDMKNCPTLDGKSICAMFNIVGRCYFGSSCHHSHDELPDDICEEMDKWIEERRKVAKDSPKKKKNGKGGGKKND
jgi:hypothetical protein